MRLPIFALLLAAALVITGISLYLASSTTRRQGVQFAVGASAAGVLLWLLVTISAFNVTTVSGGSEFTYSYPSLGVVGVLGVGVSVLILAKGSIELLGD